MIAALATTPAAAAPAAASGSGTASADPKTAEAAKGFEGLFMQILVDEMFKGTSLAGDQPMYQSMMTTALSDSLADSGGVGLAAMLTKQMGGEA